ncbi:hypothetical protein ACHAXA_008437 [Cyclostephanos tholiformis]|uniref:Protein kinase domain-containing protein n=1 Tax=Cyclostephanos tholiformis TaxID=382380 RepID=A0ABD3SBJ0_9STRA
MIRVPTTAIERERGGGTMTDVIDRGVLRRFDICQKVGRGAYGVVWKAVQRKGGNGVVGDDGDAAVVVVALKKCFEAFRCDVDARRTYREVMYLRALASDGVGHPNIIKLHDVIRADNDRDLYMTFDYSETDLSRVIKARILEPVQIQYITYQLLRALKFVHSAELLHRDVKPSNILVDSNCFIKLCDFGLCRSISSVGHPEDIEYTDYVATRWYRSPEVLMGSRRYNGGIDLWSVGCIIGEMFRCRPLMPGSSTNAQLEMIFELTGNPTSDDVESWQSPYARAILRDVRAKCRVSLDELCRDRLPGDARSLMKCLFNLDPSKRGTPTTALEHRYLADFHDPRREVVYPHGPIGIGISDCTKLTADEYRRRLYGIIAGERGESESTSVHSRSDGMNVVPPTVSFDSMEANDISRE